MERSLIQAAGYAGAAIGIVGTLGLVARSSDDGAEVVFIVAAGLTAALVGAGLLVVDHPVPSYSRMASVFWFAAVFSLGVAAQALVFGLLEFGADGSDADTASILVSVITTAGAWVLWWRLRRSLQLVAVFLTLLGTAGTVVLTEGDAASGPDPSVTAVVLWLVAVAFAVAGIRTLRPRRTALVLGTAGVVLFPYVSTSTPFGLEAATAVGAEVWALAAAIAVLAFGTYLADRAVEGIGVVAVIVAFSVLAGDHLIDSDERAVAAVIIGVALLGGSLLAARGLRPSPHPPTFPTPPPDAP